MHVGALNVGLNIHIIEHPFSDGGWEEILVNEIIATAFIMSELTFILRNNCIC